MSEGDTAVDKDILAELDREASDYLKVRLCLALVPLFPLFLFFSSFSGASGGKKRKEKKGFKIRIVMIMIMRGHRLMRSPVIRMPKYLVFSTLLPTPAP